MPLCCCPANVSKMPVLRLSDSGPWKVGFSHWGLSSSAPRPRKPSSETQTHSALNISLLLFWNWNSGIKWFVAKTGVRSSSKRTNSGSLSQLPHLLETKLSEFSKLKNSDAAEKANHAESLKSNLLNYGNNDTDFVGLFKSSRFDPHISSSGMSLSDSTVSSNIWSFTWGIYK